MNDAFISIITDYLKDKDSDYALMINGAWGSGKTYFIKNTLKAKIEKVECPIQKDNDKKKTYQQIFVSLYGVESIDEIKERIFYAINPTFKWLEIVSNKIVSATEAIPTLGSGLKNVLSCNNKEKEKIRNAIGNYVDKVFFFDDLERIDKNKIDIQSVLGYINSLTEHNHYKVIVVTNDEVLGDDYKQFKEKTIRFSYHHCPEMSDIFDSICERYEENYKKFLNKQKAFLMDIISAGNCRNIRTLIFITDVYQKIFEQVGGEYTNEINRSLLLPFTIISIEAKNGHTKEELKDVLLSINTPSFMYFLPNHKQDSNKHSTPKEEYEQEINVRYDRFKSSHPIQFYDILFDLIYDGYASPNDLESIILELRNECRAKIETEEVKLVKQIINWTQIPDDEFINVIDKLKSTITLDDKYSVADLLRIYASFVQIEAMNIDGFTLSNDDSRTFKVAIDNSMKDLPYNSLLNMQLPIWDEHNTSETRYNELRQYALDINEKNKEKAKLSEKLDVLDMIRNNDVVKFKNFMSDINNRFVFVEIEPKEIIASIISANAEIKQVLLRGLMGFFPESLSNPPQNDLNYIEKLNTELKNYLSTQTIRKPSLVNLFWIQNYLNQIISLYKTRLNVQ